MPPAFHRRAGNTITFYLSFVVSHICPSLTPFCRSQATRDQSLSNISGTLKILQGSTVFVKTESALCPESSSPVHNKVWMSITECDDGAFVCLLELRVAYPSSLRNSGTDDDSKGATSVGAVNIS